MSGHGGGRQPVEAGGPDPADLRTRHERQHDYAEALGERVATLEGKNEVLVAEAKELRQKHENVAADVQHLLDMAHSHVEDRGV